MVIDHPGIPSFESKTVLGKLYASLNEFIAKILLAKERKRKHQIDRDLVVEGYNLYLDEAKRSSAQYFQDLEDITQTVGEHSEAEIVTGDIYFSRKKHRKEWHGRRDAHSAVMEELRNQYRKAFFESLGMTADNLMSCSVEEAVLFPELMFQRVSAYYFATYSSPNAKRLSFPWLFDDVLYWMKRLKKGAVHSLPPQ